MKWDTKLLVVVILSYVIFGLFNLFGHVGQFVTPFPMIWVLIPIVALVFLFTTKLSWYSIFFVFHSGKPIAHILSIYGVEDSVLLGFFYVFIFSLLFLGFVFSIEKIKEGYNSLIIVPVSFGILVFIQAVLALTVGTKLWTQLFSTYDNLVLFLSLIDSLILFLGAIMLINDKIVRKLSVAQKRAVILFVMYLACELIFQFCFTVKPAVKIF